MRPDDLDRAFDEGKEDVLQHFDLASVVRPAREVQRVNVDFPTWMVIALDAEARRLGITRQSVIKTWIGERLDRDAG